MKLNLGCGLSTCDGWTGVDGSWNAWFANHPSLASSLVWLIGSGWKKWPREIVFARLNKHIPFSDASAEAVFTSHFLEHLAAQEANSFLHECLRILKPGGCIRIVVPDLEGAAQAYLREYKQGNMLAANNFLRRTCLGKEQRLSPWRLRDWFTLWCDYQTHYWMYDDLSLCKKLTEIGFREVARVPALQSNRIKEINQLERPGATGENGAGFAIEAIKPR